MADEIRGRTARSGLLLAVSGAQLIVRGPRVHHERTSNKPDCKENRDHPGERREGGARGVRFPENEIAGADRQPTGFLP